MKIIYTITGLAIGGAETITVNLAQRMYERGHEVHIMYLCGSQLISVPKGILLHGLHMKKNPWGLIWAIIKAKQIIKKIKPDVVHANMYPAIFFSRILRLFIQFPKLVCTEHISVYETALPYILERITKRLSDVDTNVSQEATDNFIYKKAFEKSKSLTVYNGIDLSKFTRQKERKIRKEYNIPENAFVFINVARLTEQKDQKNLIIAFNSVIKDFPNSKLLVVGDGDLRNNLERLVNELNLSESVIFAGTKNNVVEFYNSSNCFVLSSAWEGFGIVLAEAMACELPVISTDCGGTKEVVQNDIYLVSPKNSEQLATKMLCILNMSDNERCILGRENRKLVEKFDINNIVNEWIDIYQR